MSEQTTILLLGVTGQLGRLIADRLVQNKSAKLRVTSRRENDLLDLKAKFGDAVHMDLDDPRTFGNAMKGVNTLFMLTGYTVDMLVQSKALVDAAKKAGVQHIVHLGVFTPQEDCYDPHFAWHQLVEAYIKQSGIHYTFLHPNCFMQNFTGFYGVLLNGKVRFYSDKKLGWIALEDVADAAAVIMLEGSKHFGRDYWFSTDLASIADAAEIFTEVTGKKFVADVQPPEQFLKDMGKERDAIDAYFIGVEQFFLQFADGRMDYIGTVRDDMPTLVGRPGIKLRDWAQQHRDAIAAQAAK